jgi:hypothetical protein
MTTGTAATPEGACTQPAAIFLLSRDEQHRAFACRSHYAQMMNRMTVAGGSTVSAYEASEPGPWCEHETQMHGVN